MELKELIGLQLIKRIEVFHGELGSLDAVHFTMVGTRYRAQWEELDLDHSQLGLYCVGVESPADGDGFPVFCIHRDTYGELGLASDILEIYDTITAKPILVIGTEEIELFTDCRIDYYPENIHCTHKEKLLIGGGSVRTVRIPRLSDTSDWDGTIEIAAEISPVEESPSVSAASIIYLATNNPTED